MGMCKRSYETSACSVNVDRYIISSLSLVFIQDLGDLFHWFIVASIRATHNYEDPDSVFIDVLFDQLGVESVLALFANIKDPSLDLKVPGKFFQRYLSIGAHDDVWFCSILALCITLFLPSSLHGKTTKVNRF